ncbi:MAG TPA: hypothetical protein VFW22_16335 [Pseudolabrys sp.]|nr:hypothetical protein [Pseudolabrys sp.]
MPFAEPTHRSYYIDKFNDEVLPCEPTLEGWAEWLSNGAGADPEENDANPAIADGERFTASCMRWGEDVMAVLEGGQWRLFNTAKGADFIAARFGKGLGWSPEHILDAEKGDEAILKFLNEDAAPFTNEGDTEYFALGFKEPNCVLEYHTHPPRLDVVAIVQ